MYPSDFRLLRVEIEPVKVVAGTPRVPVCAHAAARCALLLAAALLGCGERPARPQHEIAAGAGTNLAPSAEAAGYVEQSTAAPAGFQPMVFTDSGTLWGIQRGRLARLSLASGDIDVTAHHAWSVAGAPGVVSWGNEAGSWALRVGDSPRRLIPADFELPGYQGPPQALWSPDGTSAVLSWPAEWDIYHELVAEDGTRSALATELEGYMLDRAVLWLDGRRILFEITAKGPHGSESQYREAGWRGDLAVLDLEKRSFERVTAVPDGHFLRVAGILQGRVLVTERTADTALAGQWLYRPGSWSREAAVVPRGTATAGGDATVVLQPTTGTDTLLAWLVVAGDSVALGRTAAGEAAVMTRDGSRIALRRFKRTGGIDLVVLRRQ